MIIIIIIMMIIIIIMIIIMIIMIMKIIIIIIIIIMIMKMNNINNNNNDNNDDNHDNNDNENNKNNNNNNNDDDNNNNDISNDYSSDNDNYMMVIYIVLPFQPGSRSNTGRYRSGDNRCGLGVHTDGKPVCSIRTCPLILIPKITSTYTNKTFKNRHLSFINNSLPTYVYNKLGRVLLHV